MENCYNPIQMKVAMWQKVQDKASHLTAIKFWVNKQEPNSILNIDVGFILLHTQIHVLKSHA